VAHKSRIFFYDFMNEDRGPETRGHANFLYHNKHKIPIHFQSMSSKDANPQAGQGILMPKKETDLFRAVVKQYECKQYKKGLKAADTVLKKFPNHGETLCMKGLILNCTGKRDEAINMVKLGLMHDMR
jgi:predicted Zn-dependent protease